MNSNLITAPADDRGDDGDGLTLDSFLQHGETVGDLGLQLVDLERPADTKEETSS